MGLHLRNHLKEHHLYTRRALFCLACALLGICLLIARLVYLQIFKNELFTTLSHNNHVTIIPIAPVRGLIYDRFGKLLANNLPAFSLEMIPEQVEDMPATIQAIQKLLSLSEEELHGFKTRLKRSRSFESIPIKMQLTDEEVAQFSIHRHLLPGLRVNATLARHYPFREMEAHIVGYVSRINEQELKTIDKANYRGTHFIGKTGVERFYEQRLHGKVGYRQVETDARGRIVRVLLEDPPEAGLDLYLSLDHTLQQTAMNALEKHRGAVVALDPASGEILALVSTPSFDPNRFVNGIDKNTYQSLTYSPDQPLFNRALRGQYPPASTIKPIFGLAGLEEGYIHPHYEIFDNGSFQLHNESRTYRDWRPKGHGWTNINKAIYASCDTFFYELAHRMGIDTLHVWMQRFGLGQITGIDLPGESKGIAPSRAWKRNVHKATWFPGETVITGIGQGYILTTPIQLGTIAATIAARGARIQPHIGLHWKKPNGTLLPLTFKSLAPIALTHKGNWETIIEGMRNVIAHEQGTAYRYKPLLQFPTAGKTGTAQVFGLGENEKYDATAIHERLRDHTLFIGFAPIEYPKIAVAVILENAKGSAEIGIQVINDYLKRAS